MKSFCLLKIHLGRICMKLSFGLVKRFWFGFKFEVVCFGPPLSIFFWLLYVGKEKMMKNFSLTYIVHPLQDMY